jgi:hypothetical protein
MIMDFVVVVLVGMRRRKYIDRKKHNNDKNRCGGFEKSNNNIVGGLRPEIDTTHDAQFRNAPVKPNVSFRRGL